ncbi:MAG: sulfite exporter TauE/SafE family protein [Fimbriimonadaceae bacterium]|nr:sulfite exporter TauE/SafE family protein [Fimbriimonadaceae bacterium]
MVELTATMIILGYIASLLIGLSLGLMGAGGSILTVPVLVYLFGLSPTQATGDSLFIVGLTAALGSIMYFRTGEIDFRVALVFGGPSLVSVYLTRALVVPALPVQMGSISRDSFLMGFFALLMLGSAYAFLRPRGFAERSEPTNMNPIAMGLRGMAVGLITGLVGAGGGFLIIPALVLMAGLPMKRAVGTSLLIIAVNSAVGLAGQATAGQSLDWSVLLPVAAIAFVGMWIGSTVAKRVDGRALRPVFGVMVLLLGVFTLGKEIFFASPPLPAKTVRTTPQ